MDPKTLKQTHRKYTDNELLLLAFHLRRGAQTGYPAVAGAAEAMEKELERRCDAHLEMFGLG